MTIVAVTDGTTVHMGADSAMIFGWDRLMAAEPKVWRHRCGFLVGVAGAPRLASIVRHELAPERPQPDGDIVRWMRGTFGPALRSTLKAHGFAVDRKESGRIVVGLDGMLFTAHADGHVSHYATDAVAIGAGCDYALGALTARAGDAPRKRIRTALDAAATFHIGAAPPFHFIRGTGTWSSRAPKPTVWPQPEPAPAVATPTTTKAGQA